MKAFQLSLIPAALLGLAVAVPASAQPGFGPPQLTLVPVEGHDNIHLIRDQFNGNITVIVGDEGVVLIDTKSAANHAGVVEFVASLTDAPIKYVINTHMHPDHAGGNPPLKDIGAAVISSENARRIMVERATAGTANITLRDTLRVWLDELPIDLYWFGRGHTDGDVIVHLPTEDVVITGDLFALWGPYRAVIDYTAGGSLRDWTFTLDRVLALPFTTLIPGHSGVTDRTNLEGYQAYLARTRQMVRDLLSQGRPREDIQAVLTSEFDWGNLELQVGLDGLIVEMGGGGGGGGRAGGRGAAGGRGVPPGRGGAPQ